MIDISNDIVVVYYHLMKLIKLICKNPEFDLVILKTVNCLKNCGLLSGTVFHKNILKLIKKAIFTRKSFEGCWRYDVAAQWRHNEAEDVDSEQNKEQDNVRTWSFGGHAWEEKFVDLKF